MSVMGILTWKEPKKKRLELPIPALVQMPTGQINVVGEERNDPITSGDFGYYFSQPFSLG